MWMRVTHKLRGQKSTPVPLWGHTQSWSLDVNFATLLPGDQHALRGVLTQRAVGAALQPFCRFLPFTGISIRLHLIVDIVGSESFPAICLHFIFHSFSAFSLRMSVFSFSAQPASAGFRATPLRPPGTAVPPYPCAASAIRGQPPAKNSKLKIPEINN